MANRKELIFIVVYVAALIALQVSVLNIGGVFII